MNHRIEKKLFGASVAAVYDCPHCAGEQESPQPDVGQTEKCPVCGGEFVVPGPIAISEKGLGKSASTRTVMILGTGVFLPLLFLAGLGGWLRLSFLCKYFLAVVGVGVFTYASKQLRIVKHTTSERRRSLYLKLVATWAAIFIGFIVISYVDPATPPLYAIQQPAVDWQTRPAAELTDERPSPSPKLYARSNYQIGLEAAQNEGDFASAVQHFTKAITIYPDYAEAYVARGCAILHSFKQHEFAIADHTTAVRLQPGFAPAYFHRAETYWDAGLTYEALEDCNRAISLDPHFASAFWLRGQVLNALEEHELATADLDRADQLGFADAPWYPWQDKSWQPAATGSVRELELRPHSKPDQSFADSSEIQGVVISDLQSLTEGMIVGRVEDDEIYDIAFPGDMMPNVDLITTVGKSALIIHSIRIAENEPIMMLKLVHFSQVTPLGVQQVTATSGNESATHRFSDSMVTRQTVSGGTIEVATMLPYDEPSARRFLNVIRNSKAYNVEVKGTGGYTTFSPGSTAREHASRMLTLFSAMKQRPEFAKDIQHNALSFTQFQQAVLQTFEAVTSPRGK